MITTFFGAGDGIRTLDPNLGKVVLRGIAAAGAIAASRADMIAARLLAEKLQQVGIGGMSLASSRPQRVALSTALRAARPSCARDNR